MTLEKMMGLEVVEELINMPTEELVVNEKPRDKGVDDVEGLMRVQDIKAEGSEVLDVAGEGNLIFRSSKVKKLVGGGDDDVERLGIICFSFNANRVLETDGDDVKGPGVGIDEAPAFRFVSWLRLCYDHKDLPLACSYLINEFRTTVLYPSS
jgi:hypothetical protein